MDMVRAQQARVGNKIIDLVDEKMIVSELYLLEI